MTYETATPEEFMRHALWWSALLAVVLVVLFMATILTNDFPGGLLWIATLSLLTTIRNLVAWSRLRRRIRAAA